MTFNEKTGTNNPFNGIDIGNRSTPFLADLDADGDLDAVIGNSTGTFSYYQNTGDTSSPTFTAQTGTNNPFNGQDAGANSAPSLVDLDNDGDLDAVAGIFNGSLVYYKNTGSNSSPTFTQQTGSNNPFNGIDVGNNSIPTFADLDNDGDLDAVIGERDGILNYYENTGTTSSPTFTAQTSTNNPFDGINIGSYSAPSLVDLDEDGDTDLVVGNADGTLSYYENTGTTSSPTFTEQTGTNNPFNGIDVGSASVPNFADLDNDGDLDLVVGNSDGVIKFFQLDATPSNQAPTDLSLTSTSVDENVAANTVIGTLSSTDPDTGDSFTYSLVSGTGDSDNAAFTIDGDQLKINASPDFETQSSYNIRVRTTDAGGESYEETLTISVNDLNEAPTALSLTSTSVDENVAANTVIGTLSSTDPDTGDSFTYSLVSGTGDSDNAAFTIDGDQLKINASPDYETQSSYSIRVRTTDAGGESYEETISINVNDLNEAPTALSLSATSVDENVAANTIIGTFSTTDPDGDTSFTYSLVSGKGDSDNSAFTIDGDQLKINASPDYETQSSYSIRVKTTDAGGESYEETLNISVNDLNEAPTALNLSASSVKENVAAATVIGTLSSTDPDAGDSFTYSLVSGTGDSDNAAFTIDGDQLKINASPDYETQSSYSIRVRTTDAGGESYEETLTISVNDLNEAPTALSLSATSVDENVAANTIIGTFSTTDPDGDTSFTYSLVSGTGDSDNSAFTIDGDQLKINASPDYETQSSYSIRVKTTDGSGESYEETLNISINDIKPVVTIAPGDPPDEKSLTLGTFVINLTEAAPTGGLTVNYTVSGTATSGTDYTALSGSITVAEGQTTATISVEPLADTGLDLNETVEVTLTTDANYTVGTNSTAVLRIADPVTPNLVDRTVSNNPFDSVNVGSYSTPSLVDLDGDSDLDLVVGSINGTLSYYQNDSSTFTEQTGTSNPFNGVFVGSPGSSPTFGDLDGDGDLDALVGRGDGKINYYKNTGSSNSPAFTQQTGTSNPFNGVDVGQASTLSLGDLDGDGDLDALVGQYGGGVLYYENTGTATNPTFTEQTGTDNPFNSFSITIGSAPSLVDLDGDGDLDAVVIVGTGVGQETTTSYYENTGTQSNPTFTEKTGNDNPFNGVNNVSTATFSDIDGDGDTDGAFGTLDGSVKFFQFNQAAPTALSLGATSVNENVAGDTVIGTFSTTDLDASDSFTYSLVSGTGDSDNSAFTIDGDQLKINASPDFETKSSYNIRVRTTDAGGESYEETISISVNDLNEAPTALNLSATSVDENVAANTVIGTLSSTDPDAGDSFTYALVSGTGDSDNAAFTIDGDQLKINASPDFESKSSYSIRVRTTDAGGESYEETLTRAC